MAYPLSSTVSRFTRITSLFNLNEWLIADGVFRHSMYNFFKNNSEKTKKWCSVSVFVSKLFSQSMEMWLGL